MSLGAGDKNTDTQGWSEERAVYSLKSQFTISPHFPFLECYFHKSIPSKLQDDGAKSGTEERKESGLITLNVQLCSQVPSPVSISLYLWTVRIGTVWEYFNAGRAKYWKSVKLANSEQKKMESIAPVASMQRISTIVLTKLVLIQILLSSFYFIKQLLFL